MAENNSNREAQGQDDWGSTQGERRDYSGTESGRDSANLSGPDNRQNASGLDENAGSQDGRRGSAGPAGKKSNRGFASMDPAEQREIASKGGKAAHQQGVAHEWSSEEAREAGRKGGQASSGGGRRQAATDSRNRSERNSDGYQNNTSPETDRNI